MNHLETITLWIEALKIPNDNYTVQIEENTDEIVFTVMVAKSYIGKILGVSGSIYVTLKRLLNSSYAKYNKKVKLEVKEK